MRLFLENEFQKGSSTAIKDRYEEVEKGHGASFRKRLIEITAPLSVSFGRFLYEEFFTIRLKIQALTPYELYTKRLFRF